MVSALVLNEIFSPADFWFIFSQSNAFFSFTFPFFFPLKPLPLYTPSPICGLLPSCLALFGLQHFHLAALIFSPGLSCLNAIPLPTSLSRLLSSVFVSPAEVCAALHVNFSSRSNRRHAGTHLGVPCYACMCRRVRVIIKLNP